MILLNKKRIILFVSIIFLSIVVYLMCFREGGFSNSSGLDVAVMVSNVDFDKKTVIVDARASGCRTIGAESKSDVHEAGLNLTISKKLKAKLEENNFNVIMTREGENAIYDSTARTIREMKNSDLKNRVKIGNNSNADIFVSIHLNKIEQSQYWGWQTFFKKNNPDSKRLAECIQKSIQGVISDRENKREALVIANKYLVDNIKIPITIVECGFLSNVEEAQLLQTDEYQNKLVEGIFQGIVKYFE